MTAAGEREELATILATWRDGEPQQWAVEMYEEAADAILAAGFRRTKPVTKAEIDAAAQALTGLSDELWAANRREAHVTYYHESARAALEAARKVQS